jgi:hypothetical protein
MAYQPQNHDYRVQAERSELDPSYFYYHFWQFRDGSWHYLYKAPAVVMTENLKGHQNIFSAEGYDYWRRPDTIAQNEG